MNWELMFNELNKLMNNRLRRIFLIVMKLFSYVFEFANDMPNFTHVYLLLKLKIALKTFW